MNASTSWLYFKYRCSLFEQSVLFESITGMVLLELSLRSQRRQDQNSCGCMIHRPAIIAVGMFDVAVGMVDVFSGQSHCAEYRSQKNTSLFHSASRSLAKRVVGMSLLRSRSVLQVKHLARKQQLVHTQIRSTVCRSIALTAIIGTHGFLRTYRALW